MDFDWKSIVGTVAPTIATALGGPLAGMATKAVISAIGLPENSREKEISTALQSATSEQLLALKKADQEFAVRMKELDIDLERINAGDRNSARNMQIQTGSYVPAILAVLITFGFFGILFYMMGWGLPKNAPNDALLIMLGSLGTAWVSVVTFYFGSSMGSAKKDEVLASIRR